MINTSKIAGNRGQQLEDIATGYRSATKAEGETPVNFLKWLQ